MLSEKAKELFDRHSPYPGAALEHHNLRILAFSAALAEQQGFAIDHDLVAAGCHLHDFGLFLRDEAEPSYLKRSWRFVEPHARQWGVSGERLSILADVLLYNHSLRTVAGLSPVGELVRRAVQIEHSRGFRRHGLDRPQIKRTFTEYPRLDLTKILVDFARITIVADGPRQLWPMFFPRRER
jgi:hypothetical protein